MKSFLTLTAVIGIFFVGGLALGQQHVPPPKTPFPPCASIARGYDCGELGQISDCWACCDSRCTGAGHDTCMDACDDEY